MLSPCPSEGGGHVGGEKGTGERAECEGQCTCMVTHRNETAVTAASCHAASPQTRT